MTFRCAPLLATAVILAAAFASTGCDQETTSSGTAGLSIRVTPSPSGVGRFTGGSNDHAEMIINKITFEPTDPELVPLLGGETLSMRFGTYTADLAASEPAEYAAIALPPGSYRITELTFRPPQLQDSEASPAAPVCFDRIAAYPSGPAAFQVPSTMTMDASDGYVFTIHPGQTKLDIAIDVPGLISSYQSAYTCEDSCGGGASCLTTFDEGVFRAAFVAHVSIQ